MIQFGRVDDDTFNLDVGYPFSLFKTFAMVLSAFDFKYSFMIYFIIVTNGRC